MPGLPIFIVGDYSISPAVPEQWSFTSLKGFEECPRRWALSRTEISCFGGTTPQKPVRSSVEGTLLHALIERLARHTTKEGAEVFRPRRTLIELITEWAKTNFGNPRIDSRVLARQVRIEEILRAFGEARLYVIQPVRRPTNRPTPTRASTAVLEGPEIWLRDPKSKLCGRADLISTGEVVDFKSGDEQDDHTEQIAFYGALHLELTGKCPSALRLIYTRTNVVREVPVPSMRELESLLGGMRGQATSTDRQVASGNFPAKPESTKCMYCHVRGLCDAYWKSTEIPLNNSAADQAPLIDYSPSASAKIEAAAFGIYIRDSWAGFPSVLHVPDQVLRTVDSPQRIRVLALRANTSPEGSRFALTQSSGIYVI